MELYLKRQACEKRICDAHKSHKEEYHRWSQGKKNEEKKTI